MGRIISLRHNEDLVIDGRIVVKAVEIRGDKIRLGVASPVEERLSKLEIYEVYRPWEIAREVCEILRSRQPEACGPPSRPNPGDPGDDRRGDVTTPQATLIDEFRSLIRTVCELEVGLVHAVGVLWILLRRGATNNLWTSAEPLRRAIRGYFDGPGPPAQPPAGAATLPAPLAAAVERLGATIRDISGREVGPEDAVGVLWHLLRADGGRILRGAVENLPDLQDWLGGRWL